MPSDSHTGCLVLFQQGKVDAITGDDTVLAGLAAQDPYAGSSAARSPPSPTVSASTRTTSTWCGSSTACSQQMRTDGRLDEVLRPLAAAGARAAAPAPPTPVYGRS